MLAYPIAEAEEMLQEKLTAAQATLSNCEEDQEFLREQITVCPCSHVPLQFMSWFVCFVVVFADRDAISDIGGRYGSCLQL